MTKTNPLSPDTYGLLILTPEVPLGSGWLGGDRVVGGAALSDLIAKAARFDPNERERLTVHLPGRQLTLSLRDVESVLATGLLG